LLLGFGQVTGSSSQQAKKSFICNKKNMSIFNMHVNPQPPQEEDQFRFGSSESIYFPSSPRAPEEQPQTTVQEKLVLPQKVMNAILKYFKTLSGPADGPREVPPLLLLRATGVLDRAVEREIGAITPDLWFGRLARQGSSLHMANLVNAISKVPDWMHDKKLCAIMSRATAYFTRCEKNGLLSEDAKKLIPAICIQKPGTTLAPYIHEIAASCPTGIPNPHLTTCWLNSLLELLRTTHAFDSLHDPAIAPHHCASEDEKMRFEILRNILHKTIVRLREQPKEPLAKEWAAVVLHLFYLAGIIHDKHRQHDATEALSALQMHLGNTEEMKIDRTRIFSDASGNRIEEALKNVESANFIPLQTSQKSASTSSLLRDYFHSLPDAAPVRFVVRDSKGQTILDGYTHFRDAEKEFREGGIKNPPLEALQALQLEMIRKDYSEEVTVARVPLTEQKLSLQTAPQHIELRINCLEGSLHPKVETIIDLSPFLPQEKEPKPCGYQLIAAFCRSGASENGAGGHFWFLENRGGYWFRYSDENVSPQTQEQAEEELNTYAYNLLYQKV
jgi:hypothetical protein